MTNVKREELVEEILKLQREKGANLVGLHELAGMSIMELLHTIEELSDEESV